MFHPHLEPFLLFLRLKAVLVKKIRQVVLYWRLKSDPVCGLYILKQQKHGEVYAQHSRSALTLWEVLACAKIAWEHTMREEYITKGMLECGYKPNTRKPWHKLKKAEADRATKEARVDGDAGLGVSKFFSHMEGRLSKKKKAPLGPDDVPLSARGKAQLSAGDFAMIGDGANGAQAMRLSDHKTQVNSIKGMLVPSLKASLAACPVAAWRNCEKVKACVLKARLLILSTWQYGYNQLPSLWLGGATSADIRKALSEQLRDVTGSMSVTPEFWHPQHRPRLLKLGVISDFWCNLIAEEEAAKAAAGSSVKQPAAVATITFTGFEIAP